MDLHPPPAVLDITRKLQDAGHDTWAVGGTLRDFVALGRSQLDWDLATHARPQEVRRLFKRTVPIGVEHGTVGVVGADGYMYHVTTFRRDVETFGRHATVEFADTIDEDLARRDFTINALAWNPVTGELRDPHSGMGDLRAGVLRTVGDAKERFAEDYLRVLRGLRFAGQFGLRIVDETWLALVAATPHLTELSAERVREELWKVFTTTPRASSALSLYAASGALAVLYPELERTIGLEQGSGHVHDAWAESLLAVDAVPVSRPLLRAAALLHGVGKPGARSRDLRGGWRFTGHEVQGARLAEGVMRRLKASNADIERVRRLVASQEQLFPPDAPGSLVRRWLHFVGPDLARDLFRLRFALWRGNAAHAGEQPEDLLARVRMMRAVVQQHPPLSLSALAVTGADLKRLGMRPGPELGETLRRLLDVVLDKPELNDTAALLELVRQELNA
jgi:tRNA nucleotidyltransferase (CCA-adding enzyme)